MPVTVGGEWYWDGSAWRRTVENPWSPRQRHPVRAGNRGGTSSDRPSRLLGRPWRSNSRACADRAHPHRRRSLRLRRGGCACRVADRRYAPRLSLGVHGTLTVAGRVEMYERHAQLMKGSSRRPVTANLISRREPCRSCWCRRRSARRPRCSAEATAASTQRRRGRGGGPASPPRRAGARSSSPQPRPRAH